VVVGRPVVVLVVELSDEQPIAATAKKKRHFRIGVPRLEMMSDEKMMGGSVRRTVQA